MAIVDGRGMLRAARAGKYGVPAFNVFNLEMVQAVCEAAAAERAPVVIQVSPRTVGYAGLKPIAAIVRAVAGETTAPICLHLDHGPSEDACKAALSEGFSSVMFDGSARSWAENVAQTRRIVELAHAFGASAEAELGEIGHASQGDTGLSRTDPEEAARFARETGVDALAAAIGTVHGMADTGATLDIPLVAELANRVDAALVMHGSSGVDDESLVRAIAAGIVKVNLSTALQKAFMAALRVSAAKPGNEIDARAVLGDARAAVVEAVRHRIQLTGASGRAA